MSHPSKSPVPSELSTALTAPADPYDHRDERNHLAVHRPDERAIALSSKLGKLLLTEQSEFAAICRASGIPAERLVLELIACARKRPAILQCTNESIMTFMFDAAKLGLQIGRGVFPVPLNRGKGRERVKVLEAWVGYKGNKQLVIESGVLRDCWAQVVFTGDDYEFTRAPIPNVVRHNPGPHFGDMQYAYKVYAVALYAQGSTRAVELSAEDILKRRSMNKSNMDPDSPWLTHGQDMWEAKAILELTSDLPQGGLGARLEHARTMAARAELAAPADPIPEREVPADPAEPTEPPGDDETAFADALAEPMSVGEAESIPIVLRGGKTRCVRELRTAALEHIRGQARARLDVDPENPAMARIAEACSLVLEARAAGTLKEPPLVQSNG